MTPDEMDKVIADLEEDFPALQEILGLRGSSMTPRESSQIEAERTFEEFIKWSKRSCMFIAIVLLLVVFGCNNGVEVGTKKTGSKYNGAVYEPSNVGE